MDRTILNILQRNAKCPLKEIAEKVYLSTPAVSARIEKMEKEGLTILVKPIDKHEEIQIVLKRYLEKIVLHFYKKQERKRYGRN